MSIVASVALAVHLAFIIGVLLYKGLGTMRRNVGLVFMLIAAGFLHSMATKPQGVSVEFDDYLANDGTYYTTNGTTKVGVTFKWTKTRADLPNTQPLYISRNVTNEETSVLIATTTVGGSPFAVTIADPMRYHYTVWHEWMPPSPVYTNGVWLGTVLEKAKGDTGLNKMIIIHGEIRHDGKKIATP